MHIYATMWCALWRQLFQLYFYENFGCWNNVFATCHNVAEVIKSRKANTTHCDDYHIEVQKKHN